MIVYAYLKEFTDRAASDEDVILDSDGKDGSKFTMAQFAKLYFRQPRHASKEKDWTWKDLTEKVKFTLRPIPHSLLKLEDGDLDKIAQDSFLCIMRYMGDESLKRGQTLTDCVYELLTICHQNPRMRDEVFCQIVKQVTNNRSPKTHSASRGWRLFSILCAYFECSLVFKPYLFKYLNDMASNPSRAFYGTASTCLQNLTKTFKYGGRKELLNGAEVAAITVGKTLRHIVYYFPGGHKQLISTSTVTVAEEIIQEMCQEINILSSAEQQEFCLCVVLPKEETMKMISNDEYILDICTSMEMNNKEYLFILKRTVWIHPLRLDNDLYIDFMFFQVSQEQVVNLVPKSVLAERTNAQWADRINIKLESINREMTAVAARQKFLESLSKWPLFGSQFIFIFDAVDGDKHTGDCLLVINKHGLKFLNTSNQSIPDIPLTQILTTNKYETESGSFLDIKVGKLLDKRTLTLETDKGNEISRLMGQYIYVDSKNRGYIDGGNPE
uniref:MyTH4 domain-containing protein n=1 Tax=Syphacia muris TaxID=451379 RepID=A0A0N5AY33_9BILA